MSGRSYRSDCGRKDTRSFAGPSSRANPSRGGDAKPGIFRQEDRPVAVDRRPRQTRKESNVKGNLVRLTWVLSLLASLALTVAAGYRWL